MPVLRTLRPTSSLEDSVAREAAAARAAGPLPTVREDDEAPTATRAGAGSAGGMRVPGEVGALIDEFVEDSEFFLRFSYSVLSVSS